VPYYCGVGLNLLETPITGATRSATGTIACFISKRNSVSLGVMMEFLLNLQVKQY